MDSFTFDLFFIAVLVLGGADSLIRLGWWKLCDLLTHYTYNHVPQLWRLFYFKPPTWVKVLKHMPVLLWRGIVLLNIILVLSLIWLGGAS